MASNLIGWFSKFFRDSGIGTSNPEGKRTVILKKEMIAYTYRIKQKFFEENSTKIWRRVDHINALYSSISKTFRSSLFPELWNLDWDIDNLDWIEMSLENGELQVALCTTTSKTEFRIYMNGNKEVYEPIWVGYTKING